VKSVREACHLRDEVLKGDLQDALFAADFGHVVAGRAPAIYREAAPFFANTHPAVPLKKVVTTIFARLADPKEPGAAVRLSTGFGGGKTHTLIALWHLARNIQQTTLGTELLPAAGRPKEILVAGIDGDKLGATVCGRHGPIVTHSLWGELAYQLGGEPGYSLMQAIDDPDTPPDAALIRALLPEDKPVLILLDELVKYMVKLSDHASGALVAFISSLVSEVGARTQAVIVITDPAGQAAYQHEAADLKEAIKELEAAHRLDDELGRKTTDFDPIGSEAAQVIARRLFSAIEPGAAHEASAEYFNAYQRIRAAQPDSLPAEATTTDYASSLVACYPFHPRLLETAQNRLGALQGFHKSRGTLRLFARILRDLWEDESNIALITAGDLDWTSDRIQADLLQRLNRDQFKPAVDADVVKHAGAIDADFNTDVHQRVAAALLLESIPLNPNASMDRSDIALAVLRPDDVGHEPAEAMDRLMSLCWHTYKDDTGRRYQFRFEPNVNKLVEERATGIHWEDARQHVLTLAQGYFSGPTFKLIPFPGSAKAVADTALLKLVLTDSLQLAQEVCDYDDDSDPAAKHPRPFRNAIFGLAPTPAALDEATRAAQLLLAAELIDKEQKQQKGKSTLKDQLDELLPTIRKRARIQAVRAFNRVVFQGRPSVTLEEKYLVSEDKPLDGVRGQDQLKRFLDDNKLVYQPTDAIDVDLLVGEILPGATPSLDHPGAFTASSVHERALSNERLRLLANETPVRSTVIKAVEQDRLLVRLSSGDSYDSQGCVTTVHGVRKRIDRKLAALPLNSDTLIAPADAPCPQGWIHVPDVVNEPTPLPDGGPGPHPPGPQVTIVSTWDEAIERAAERPLQKLTLKAASPETAKTLIALAQPFGAQALTLSVVASGNAKDGGMINFAANNLKHNHPLKPIDLAATLCRAMDGQASFNASLALDFGEPGSADSAPRLEQARDNASPDVSLSAEFGAGTD
jgi:hypothetical protein